MSDTYEFKQMGFEAWLPKSKVLELATPAWEFDDDLMNAALELKNQLVIHGQTHMDVYDELDAFIDQMRKARLEEQKNEHN